MTSTIGAMDPFAVPTPAAPDLGELVPMGHVVIKLDVSAETTMPDTPNGYTAAIKVMADQGDLNTEALDGDQGPVGQIGFQVREAVDPTINSPADLRPLPNTKEYIGRYFLLEDIGPDGEVVGQSAYIWYGSSYRRIMMGTFGPPGPVPEITPLVELIDPYDANNNPNQSYVEPSGPRLTPTWEFFLASPDGPSGPVTPIYLYPDVDEVTNPPVNGDLMTFTGKYTVNGNEIWAPIGLGGQLPVTFSMPESAFSAYSGVTQQAAIGSFTVTPAPAYPWTPIVWGHIGGTQVNPLSNSNAQHLVNVSAYGGTFTLTFGGLTTPPIPYNASPATIVTALEGLANVGSGNVVGSIVRTMNTLLEWVNNLGGQAVQTLSVDASQLTPSGIATAVVNVVDSGGNIINELVNMLTGDPFMIGAQVLLGDPTMGYQVARGMGTTLGHVNIYPHYSSSANNQNKKNQAIRPGTGYAVVAANEPDPAKRTVYVNLWNDGQIGVYDFNPTNAQLFLMVQPMGPIATPQLAAGYPALRGEGFLSATVQRVVP